MSRGVTNDCNLRCGYCVYGGEYDYMRVHSATSMKYEIYKQAIDFLFEIYSSPLRVSRKPVRINFYGGEPLLEIENILKAENYAMELYSSLSYQTGISFGLTTNGVRLNVDIAQKLLERDFDIDISLDGPKEQHDLFRKKRNGNGSFDDIAKNIKKIQDKFPVYFAQKIKFYVTLHPAHDLLAVEKFFIENHKFFNENNVSVFRVNMKGLDPKVYDSVKKSFVKQFNHIEQTLDKDQWFYKKIIRARFEDILEQPTRSIATQSSFAASCRPAESRIFVDTGGCMHICEKLNPYLPIGNVFDGFDFHAIQKILESWRAEKLSRKCWECDPWWICNQCFANCATSEGVKLSTKACFDQTEGSKKSMARFIASLERDDEKRQESVAMDSVDKYLDLL